MTDEQYRPISVHDFTDPVYQIRDDMPAMSNAKVAKRLQVVQRGGTHSVLYIDGELFPYCTHDGFGVAPMRRATMPGVTFTLVGWRVELLSDLRWKPETE